MPKGPINTTLTETFGIQHPIMLAGMNVAAGPKLAAAVTVSSPVDFSISINLSKIPAQNAGGLGVIGGLGYTPKVLRQQVCANKIVFVTARQR